MSRRPKNWKHIIRCKKRLSRLFKNDWKDPFPIKKVTFYTSNKDKILFLSNSGVIYKYIGKTENIMFDRTKQHDWAQPDSAIRTHFNFKSCEHWKEIVGMCQTDSFEIDTMDFQISCVRDNTEVINRWDNWLNSPSHESLVIKEWKPELNHDLKSCKELALFPLMISSRMKMWRQMNK